MPGLNGPAPIAPFLDGAFPSTTPGADPNAEWTTQNYFPDLKFVEPIRIVEHPSVEQLAIVSKDGQIWLVDNQTGANTKTLFLDLKDRIQGLSPITPGEGGIGGFVFHPHFGLPGSPNRGYVFVWYRWSPEPGFFNTAVINGYNRLSRFNLPDGSSSIDVNSEIVLIQQFDREQYHIGGDMFFGNDGFLYITVGDEGNCCDRLISTQRIDLGLFSGVLRIDVDKDSGRSHPIRRQPQNPAPPPAGWPASFTQEYYIPNDNPFVDPVGNTLEEFYAIGLRHAWTMTQDPETGLIWVADVGQNDREEVNILSKGDNYQWAYMEGTITGLIPKPANIVGVEKTPIWDYGLTGPQAIIGAGVYRGSQFPELQGKYLFSDFLSGQFWTLVLTNEIPSVTQIATLPSGFPNGINEYHLDRHGRVLLAKTTGALDANGTILELIRQGNPAPQPPAFLSETGAFQDLVTLDAHEGCVPYDLNVPFWSDGALKQRWMCIPNDGVHDISSEQIGFSEEGDWTFPVGAVLIKHFEILLDEDDPNSAKRLETRFFVHAEGGYYGVTYKWNEDGSDAELLLNSLDEELEILTANGSRSQTWHYPSRTECLRCHNTNAGGVLGPKTRQLNRDLMYPSTDLTANQLVTLNFLGILSPSINDAQIPNFLTSTPPDDVSVPIEARARSYLDSNCSYCHRPGGVRANFDTRLSTPLAQQGLIHGALVQSLNIPDEAIIVPGNLDQSVLYHRVNSSGEGISMPPLAKNLVDEQGVSVIAKWIENLTKNVLGNETDTDAPFLDSHHPSLYINKTDVFQNNAGEPISLSITDFSFYARRLGNPLTPFVVKVNAANDFTVLAIGATQTNYVLGENHFAFASSGGRDIQMMPGETIAVGFMDSFPDGTGWGAGSVIPAGSGQGEDEIWGLLPDPLINVSDGFVAGRDTPTIIEGESPLTTNAGKALKVYPNLGRSYHFAIAFSVESTGGPPPNPSTLVNGSFEQPVLSSNFDFFTGSQISGWTVTQGDVDIVSSSIWTAANGTQSLDLNGHGPGAIAQTLSGLSSGGTYTLSFSYARNSFGPAGVRSASIQVNGEEVGTISTSQLAPNYTRQSFMFIVPTTGSVTIAFVSTSSGDIGIVLDDIQLQLESGGVPGGGDEVCPAPVNMAPSGIAMQSSGYQGDQFPASNALDGTLTNFTHTQTDQRPASWTLALAEEVAITSILLHNRQSCCASRLRDITVQILGPTGTMRYQSPLLNPENVLGNPAQLVLDLSSEPGGAVAGQQIWVIRTPDPDLSGSGGSGDAAEPDVLSLAEVTVNGCTISEPPANNAPILTPVANQSHAEGESVTLSLSASDPDGDSLSYSATGLPPGLTINPSSGVIGGTLSASSDGAYSVTVTVNDGDLSDSDTFTWIVSEAGGGVCTVPTNVAPSGVATQSSGYQGDQFPASNALDGTLTNFTHTQTDQRPASWTLALAEEVAITSILLHNRQSCCASRLRDITVQILGPTGTIRYQSPLLNPENVLGNPAQLVLDLSSEPGGAVAGQQIWVIRTPDPDLSGSGGSGIADEPDVLSLAEVTVNGCVTAQPGVGIVNGSFENDSVAGNREITTILDGWTVANGNVEVITDTVFSPPHGTQSLDLNGTLAGTIEQTLTGLTPNTLYTVFVAYADQSARSGGGLATAEVSIDGSKIGDIRTTSDAETLFVTCNGYEFLSPSSGTATLQLHSTTPGAHGIVVDNMRLQEGGLPLPPESPSLINGSFEAPFTESDPHLCGFQLPGWFITRENVDVVGSNIWPAFDGDFSLDLGGHGPGRIAQTVTGLMPGQTYTLEFAYARHMFWGSDPLTADVLVNGVVVSQLVATTDMISPNWQNATIQTQASADGKITIEFQSTSLDVGGSVVIDAVKLTN